MSKTDLIAMAERVVAGTTDLDQRLELLGRSVDRVVEERNTLRVLVADLVAIIDEVRDDTDGRWPLPEPGCIDCTQGATPDRSNTGPCVYHRARRMLRDLAAAAS